MSKRTSDEARIVEWFQTAPEEAVEIVFGIVKAILKRRLVGRLVPVRRKRETVVVHDAGAPRPTAA